MVRRNPAVADIPVSIYIEAGDDLCAQLPSAFDFGTIGTLQALLLLSYADAASPELEAIFTSDQEGADFFLNAMRDRCPAFINSLDDSDEIK